jgi:hypothetical protein
MTWTLCNILVYTLTSPLLFLLSLVGFLAWLFLLPFSFCLGPLTCAVDIALYIAKAPLHLFRYLFSGG